MKNRKILSFVFAFAVLVSACTKDPNVEEVEEKLPRLALNNIGLIQQTGPFALTDILQLSFAATTTKTEPGPFDVSFYDDKTRVDSVHFDSWNNIATAKSAPNITYIAVATTYPNTVAYQGTINLKLNKLVSGKKYTVKAYARSADKKADAYTPYQQTVTNLVVIK